MSGSANAHPELAALVDITSYLRGADYFRRGRAAVESHDWTERTATGTVGGAGGRQYRTSVEYELTRNGSITAFFGDCSCPVGVDCKHSVALVLTALGSGAEQDPSGAGFGLAGARGSASWARYLQSALYDVPEAGTAPLAIGFEFEPARNTHWGRQPAWVQVRLLRQGKRGWVKLTGRWSNLANAAGIDELDPAHVEIATDLGLVCLPGAETYGGRGDRADLRHVASGVLWTVLDQARRAGMAMVTSGSGPQRPVLFADAAHQPVLDLRAGSDGSLALTAGLRAGEETIPLGEAAMIGQIAHGVVQRAPDGTLTVLRLTERAGRLWTRLAGDGPVAVPAADANDFTERYLPQVSARGRLIATGAAAELTSAGRPELVMSVRLPGAHTATVDWALRYRTGSTVREISLGSRGPSTVLRDRDAEDRLLEQASQVLAAHGWPAPSSRLVAGAATVRLLTGLIPDLEQLPDVVVEVSGDRIDYREITDGPEIVVGTEPGTADPGSTDWLDLSVTVTLGGRDVPFDQLFRALASGEDALFLPDGTWCALDSPELQRLRTLIEEARGLQDKPSAGLRVSRYGVAWFTELEELGLLTGQAREWADRLRALRTADLEPAPLPEGLCAELRPYQLEGFRWLDVVRRNGLGGILADDMGLGKTVQTLAMILAARTAEPEAGPFLVVAPTSVVGNWAAEAARFTPGLRVATITETGLRRSQSLAEIAAGCDILITSYTLFRLEFDAYRELAVAGLVLDEAQAVKNHRSKAFGCVKQMPAPVKIAITGTPMENNVMELWSLFAVAAPGLLGTAARFTENYRTPIEKGGDGEVLARLRARVAPLMLRRTKELVARDLPEKQEQVLEFDLEPAHRRVYARHLQRERQKVLKLIEDVDGNRFEILRSLTLLRQLAIDPQLVEPEHDDVASTKLSVLMDLVTEISAEHHRVLVFSQFTRFLGRIARQLEEAGIEFCYLDGTTRDRQRVVNEFKSGSAPVFLISLKAGGVGLNLAEADYCVIMDPWWNPATEAQAVDRAHRIGQTRPVMVYRLVSKDTIEDKVMTLKRAKSALIDSVMSDSGIASATLSAADIRALLD